MVKRNVGEVFIHYFRQRAAKWNLSHVNVCFLPKQHRKKASFQMYFFFSGLFQQSSMKTRASRDGAKKSRGLEIITCRSFPNFLAGVRIFASFLPPLYNFCFHFTLGNTILSACSFDVRRYSAKVAWKQDSFAQPLENIVVFICTFFYKFYYFWQTVFQSREGEHEVEGGL